MSQDFSFILPLPIMRILGLSCTQIGFFAYSENQQLRLSSDKIASLPERYDFLIAIDPNDISEYQHMVKPTGTILYNENTIPSLRAHKWFDHKRKYIPIALDSFAKIWGQTNLLRPFVALGSLAGMIGLDIETLFHYLPTQGTIAKQAYQDCIVAGYGYIRSIDQSSDHAIKPMAYDSSRLYISGFDGLCLALRKADHATIALPQQSNNFFYQSFQESCEHYDIRTLEGSTVIFGTLPIMETLREAYSNHILIIHHHDETALFAATSHNNSYIVSDLASLYSHIYWALLKQQVEHTGTIIFVADDILMSYQTLPELPIPSDHLYEPYYVQGSERARIGILSTGSSKGIITETQDLLKSLDISTKYIHFNYVRDIASKLDTISSKCDLLLITPPLTTYHLPEPTCPHQEIQEWHDAQHLSTIIEKIINTGTKTQQITNS